MNMSLELISVDGGATAILGGLTSDRGLVTERELRIPEEVREALAVRKAAGMPTTGSINFLIGAQSYNCRVFMIQPNESAKTPQMLALYLQKDSSVTDAIDVVAAQYQLTEREQEALKGIAIGLTSKEMADRMNISPNTVKSFLRIIMLKMGAATRTGIVSKLLEHSNNNHNGKLNGNLNGPGSL
jgi:DNA-binding CsgD family transcriptional regulator